MSFLNIFGKKKTPKELLRENKRQIDRAIRDIDRERMSLQSQEKKLIVEMKKMAKNNQNEAVKVMAKSLIRMRHNITKYYTVKSQWVWRSRGSPPSPREPQRRSWTDGGV